MNKSINKDTEKAQKPVRMKVHREDMELRRKLAKMNANGSKVENLENATLCLGKPADLVFDPSCQCFSCELFHLMLNGERDVKCGNHAFWMFLEQLVKLVDRKFTNNDENADPNLRNGLSSALAENFKVDVKFPQKDKIFSALFRMDPNNGNDIMLDLEWLEQINSGNLLKSNGAITHHHHEIHSRPSSVDPLEMQLNELKIPAEVSAGSNALDLVKFPMKKVDDKLGSISLSDDNESAKAVIENEIKKPLKLSAGIERLEADFMSLQKEYNMLKDMVKGPEQTRGENKEVKVTVKTPITTDTQTTAKYNHDGHSHSHSHSRPSSPSIPDEHGKDDCTLFGKNQNIATNPRSTEKRDKLRKKLQNQKECTTTTTTTTTVSNSSNGYKSKNLKNISLLLKNNSQAAKNGNKIDGKSSNASATNVGSGKSMKMKVKLELQQRKKKTLMRPVDYTIIRKQPREEVTIQSPNELNVQSLENLIEYIEAPTNKAVDEKKKKSAQKIKRRRQKLIKKRQKQDEIDSLLDKLTYENQFYQNLIEEVAAYREELLTLKETEHHERLHFNRINQIHRSLKGPLSDKDDVEEFVLKTKEEIWKLSSNFDLEGALWSYKGILSIVAQKKIRERGGSRFHLSRRGQLLTKTLQHHTSINLSSYEIHKISMKFQRWSDRVTDEKLMQVMKKIQKMNFDGDSAISVEMKIFENVICDLGYPELFERCFGAVAEIIKD